MIRPSDLLDFAFDLSINAAHAEVHARRAVSAAYYALFHTITQAGAALFDVGPELRERIARSYDHGAVGSAAKNIERPPLASGSGARAGSGLVSVAKAFSRLREAREKADYDLAWSISWDEAEELFWEASEACRYFEDIKAEPATVEFLLAPLLRDRNRRG